MYKTLIQPCSDDRPRSSLHTNADYISKLNDSIAQADRGEVVMYTKEQMHAMETV